MRKMLIVLAASVAASTASAGEFITENEIVATFGGGGGSSKAPYCYVLPTGERDCFRQPVRDDSSIYTNASQPNKLNSKVEFDNASARLNFYGRKNLDTFIQAAERNPQLGLMNKKFAIVGHTSTPGADDYNMRLSQMRAEAVVQYLVTQGQFSRAQFTVAGKGETQTLAGLPGDDRRNRRVMIEAL